MDGGGDDHLHQRHQHHHQHNHRSIATFPFQLLEKKEDEACSSSSNAAAAYTTSLAISNTDNTHTNPNNTPRSTISTLQISASGADTSKKPPPKRTSTKDRHTKVCYTSSSSKSLNEQNIELITYLYFVSIG